MNAVTPTYLPATAADLHSTYVHDRTIHTVASFPPYSEGVQRVPLVLHTRCLQVILEVRGHLRWCKRRILFRLRFLGR